MNKGLKAVTMVVSSLVMIAGALASAGCSSSEPHRIVGRTIDDDALTAKIKTDLLRDREMRGCNVNVDTYAGDVQLNGWVDTPEQKREAEAVAHTVKGVRTVQNNLAFKEAAGAEGRK